MEPRGLNPIRRQLPPRAQVQWQDAHYPAAQGREGQLLTWDSTGGNEATAFMVKHKSAKGRSPGNRGVTAV